MARPNMTELEYYLGPLSPEPQSVFTTNYDYPLKNVPLSPPRRLEVTPNAVGREYLAECAEPFICLWLLLRVIFYR